MLILTTELVRYKNQEKCFEINQEKYDELEKCYQKSAYQEQCFTKKINALHLSYAKTIMTLNEEIANFSNQLSKEKSTVSSIQEEKKKLNSDFKICKDELLDKQIQLENKIKELYNILVKTGQSIQTMHMLSPKPDSFYHTKQKMALGYKNPFYLKHTQQKQQSLYNGKVLLEKHDPPAVYDSEETLQLAQESRLKMKQLNKEIKPANYAKINQLSGVFVSKKTKSREELYFSNISKTASVSKSISIPNEEFSNDTTLSVARKLLNEVKSTIMTLQLDASVHNFEIQILKEAAKFVRDFKSLAKEADESLDKHKTLEFEIERLSRAIIKRSQAQLGDQKGKSKDTPCVSNTLDSLSQKLENENVELEFQVIPKVVETNDLSKPLTSNSVPTTTESKVVTNDKVISPGMFRINPFKTSREDKFVTINKVRASVRINLINVSQPHVITKKHVNSDLNANQRVSLTALKVVQICSWCVDSGCSKNMTGNMKLLINFVWKFLGTVHFGNDHVAVILGYGDLQWGNILITRVYFVKGLGHNLFLVGQFCDLDLEVTFRRKTWFVRNLEGVDLLKGNCTTNLYTINLHEMASASPIFLMARATSTMSWLWHQRLSHLNFDTINDLAKNDLVTGLPKFKYHKEHLCSLYEQGKSKKASHPPTPVPNSKQRLHLLHMDLCGPMRVESINGKRYVLV
ncbi:retrovirus-related pol polyprotein from transposon TNT 1-94 [Tanacetum coccineum]